MNSALVWFRRDLRLDDHPALACALEAAPRVIPCVVLDPAILRARDTGPARVAFFLESLRSLRESLRARGGDLHILEGKPEEVLIELARSHRAGLITWNIDYEPYAVQRDRRVAAAARKAGLETRAFHDQCLHPPGEIIKTDGRPYVVFTPYYRQWQTARPAAPLPAPDNVPGPAARGASSLPDPASLGHPDPGPLPPAREEAAQGQLTRFVQNDIDRYDRARDIPILDATSRLSPHLRFGLLSARRIHRVIGGRTGPGARIFLSELAWRDFYKQILHFFPHVATGAYRTEYDAIAWPNDKRLFQAWCEGRTGFPIVDAAMRQLNQTGWMHNRLRMITASFLSKDLQVDWRWGERYFMRKLIDGDLAANNGGWQWAAGTGTDAAPYFRIFNPARQAERFDPEGKFIERWVPEIDTPAYPAPIVDHQRQRDSTLRLYKAALGPGGGAS